MEDQLRRVLDLAKRTGDRVIIYNSANPESVFVAMSLEAYEKLSVCSREVKNLTENQLLDKINRDIAIWKSEQSAKEQRATLEKDFFYDNLPASAAARPFGEYEGGKAGYFEPIPDFFASGKEAAESKSEKKKQWQIPKDRKEAAEEVIEEDRQYLEEIRY